MVSAMRCSSSPLSSYYPYSSSIWMDSQFRRLSKVRHQEMNKMEIKTKSESVSLIYDPRPYTIYMINIFQSNTTTEFEKWVLEKRYSEFYYFRRDLLKRIEQELSHLNEIERFLIINCLKIPLRSKDFPRRHMRCDTEEIIAKRQEGLQAFVRKLLNAYADLSAYLFKCTGCEKNTKIPTCCQMIKSLSVDLEKFLKMPKSQKDTVARKSAWILSLEDVDETQSRDDVETVSSSEDNLDVENSCCLCLGELDTTDEQSATRMVRLPCSHQFHEDCVLEWFDDNNTITSCPECRYRQLTVL